jgi:hypothetical protein
MKLKDYVESLQKVLNENPDAANFKVIFARDDEGNGFQEVCYSPSVGHFDGDYGGDFYAKENIEEDYNIEEMPLNSVCIN